MLIISWNVRPSLSFVRIKYGSRAEEEITLEEIPCLKCSIFGLNMLVYILNTVSLYFITRVAFLVIVRLKIDFKIHVIIMMDCGSIRQSFQIIIAITILWRVKTYDDNISDSCWFNIATIWPWYIYHNVVEAAMYIIWCYEVLYCRILGQLLVINAWNTNYPTLIWLIWCRYPP